MARDIDKIKASYDLPAVNKEGTGAVELRDDPGRPLGLRRVLTDVIHRCKRSDSRPFGPLFRRLKGEEPPEPPEEFFPT